MTLYEKVLEHGHHIVGLPWRSLPENWTVYSAPWNLDHGVDQAHITSHYLYWINHDTKECVDYYRFERLVDPTTFPYDMKG